MSDSDDEDFEQGDAEADDCYPIPAGDVKKGHHVSIKG
jgi:hypothetical protein